MAVLTKKQIESRVIEALRTKPAQVYPELERKVFPSLFEMSDKSVLWFREILTELKGAGKIRWERGEIELLPQQPETAAFGAAPENATLKRKGVFRKRKRA